MWSSVESNLGIICACLPLLRPLLIMMIPWLGTRTALDRGDRVPRYYGEISHSSGSRKTRHTISSSHLTQDKDDLPWDGGGKDHAFLMSSATVADRENNSRDGSEIEITHGIRRKVDLEHSVEFVFMDHESDRDIEFPPEVHWNGRSVN